MKREVRSDIQRGGERKKAAIVNQHLKISSRRLGKKNTEFLWKGGLAMNRGRK